MRVATFNVHKCVGPDGAYRPDRVAAVIAELKADLVAVQEADQRLGKRNGLLDPDHLLETTGMHLLSQSDLPNGHGWHGNTLLVRTKPVSYSRSRLALPGKEARGAVMADIDFGFGPIRFIATHMGLLRNCRYQQAGAILSALARLPPIPTVLLGDLNEWRAWRGPLKVFEPFFGRSQGCPSFPSRMPLLSLDRIMGWPHNLISEVEVHRTPLAREASDHLPVKAILRVDAMATANNDAFEAQVGMTSDA
ncbi:MAG: endonuclease/exonuclease/phosphatase family protein [Rhodopila sp.]|nr:endonuclease/exonuclease/phosphatase family protein [Rhodopila sp.]